MFVGVYSVKIVVKNDSSNAIDWVSASNRGPWRFHFFKWRSSFSLMIQVEFSCVLHSVNSLADSLAKQGVEQSSPSLCNFIWLFVV